jgi:hypothetical protein
VHLDLGSRGRIDNLIASRDTIGRVFAALDLEQFEADFRSRAATVVHLIAGGVFAVNGKQLRHSHDETNGEAALTLSAPGRERTAWRWVMMGIRATRLNAGGDCAHLLRCSRL